MVRGLSEQSKLKGYKSKVITSDDFGKKGLRKKKISKRSIAKRMCKIRAIKRLEPASVRMKLAEAQVSSLESCRSKQVSTQLREETRVRREDQDVRQASVLPLSRRLVEREEDDGRFHRSQRDPWRPLHQGEPDEGLHRGELR